MVPYLLRVTVYLRSNNVHSCENRQAFFSFSFSLCQIIPFIPGGKDAATCHRFCFGVNFSLREFVQSG